jgi:hypothetical protein
MLSVEAATTLLLATDAAVIIAVNAVPTVAGAVYVTDVVVAPESDPQTIPLHPVPLKVHITPALVASFVTDAVRLAELLGSTLVLEGPWIVTPVGLGAGGADGAPPQPLISRPTIQINRNSICREQKDTDCF